MTGDNIVVDERIVVMIVVIVKVEVWEGRRVLENEESATV